MASTTDIVRIHYRRPPDDEQIFEQRIVHRDADCVVTLLERANVARPIVIGGRPVLVPGAPVVWFTFRRAWHDIGRFHDAADRPTGLYANILTPVDGIATTVWRTTDLFLDVWMHLDGTTALLDEDELEQAEHRGWVEASIARRARAEAASLIARAATGDWPPSIVAAWTLERARSRLR